MKYASLLNETFIFRILIADFKFVHPNQYFYVIEEFLELGLIPNGKIMNKMINKIEKTICDKLICVT